LGKKRRGRAQRADRYELYEKSVQEPDADVALMRRIFKNHFGRPPRLLREDFCGTAVFACEWVKRHAENRAWAIDLDPVPLEWGQRQHLAKLRPEQAARIKLIQGDVLDVGHRKVDVTVAFNFSYFLFRTRDELRGYFDKARNTLQAEGLLLLDAYGGADSQRTQMERRKQKGFTYLWDQHSFDPISHSVTNFIHFEFSDGSRLRRAFRYDWRLWTLPEIRELLMEAGFRKTEVYWEGTEEETGEGNGIFRQRERAPDDPAWIAYIAALP
jgi:cyclopropane fatty-acyl-phospholipid synthase-like methyltransferase